MTLPALILLAGADLPPDQPPVAAARDTVLGYHLRPASGEAIDIRVEIQAGNKSFRVDLPDTSYLVGMPASQSLTMIVPLQRTLVTVAWNDGPQSLFTVDDRARFMRRGDTSVAGQRCTQWDAIVDGVTHLLCVSADGLVLRNQFADRQGRRNLVEAFSVRYDTIGDGDVAIPEGFESIFPGQGPTQ